GGSRAFGNARRRDLIIDPPADVVRVSLPEVAPPGVTLGPWVEAAKHVHPSMLIEQARQPRPLLGQEPGVLLIAPPVFQINFAVRDVDVATQDELTPTFGQPL